MEWGEDCQHGLKWQDDHHKQLVATINRLLDSVVIGSGDKKTFDQTLKFIDEFSKGHFRAEELYMEKHGYPRRENHVKEHQRFVADFDKFIFQYNFQGLETSIELLNKLNIWFFHHTQTTDKFLAEFLLKYEGTQNLK